MILNDICILFHLFVLLIVEGFKFRDWAFHRSLLLFSSMFDQNILKFGIHWTSVFRNS